MEDSSESNNEAGMDVGVDVALDKEALLEKWNDYELSFEERDTLLDSLQKSGLLPRTQSEMDEWETQGGLYPDLDDPRFAEKIMRKQEFAENKQESILSQMESKVNPCDPDREFELTPVQRFIGRFLSPQCPYQSALLYHGVGVGKTCAAITIAENYLRSFPRNPVYIVAPRTIQPGFRRTIFDDETLKIGEGEDEPNTANGCTGNTYLKRTGSEFERDKSAIIRRVSQSINSRYIFLGYIQFHRMIDDILKKIPKGLDEEAKKRQQRYLLRREFSGKLLIIDEAHNLRDTPGETAEDDVDVPGGELELTETQAGKRLTPSLLKVLDAAFGMKLTLLSGTPMYNSYREIIFLLKLLLLNDKRATITERDIFMPSGAFKPGGEEILGGIASAYVSFMRGENPLSFPVRLKPEGVPNLDKWVERSPNGSEIPDNERERMLRLPFVPIQYEGESMAKYQRISEDAIEGGGMGVGSIDEMVQSGNWIYPGEEGSQIRDAGFDACFTESSGGGQSQFTAKEQPTWLLTANLGGVSPKAKFTLENTRSSKGVIFVYSRFIKSGALPLALALEANGYTPWGDRKPLLTNGIQHTEGRQCALCSKRERGHLGTDHKFVPAKYILISGRANLSPNNPVAIQAARAKTNMDGREVKVIIGSQVASEGVDFRFVREIYVFDSWFHLNKMEQVLGRGIRTCSHALLPSEKRNCTTYLLVNTFGEEQDTETADMYMYRNAMAKAIQVGRVTRVLKQNALDCNLNREAIIVTGLATQRHEDSQGKIREEVDINDTPYTNMCDWIETCDYKCAKPIQIDDQELDLSTYDEYAIKWRESQLKQAVKRLFETSEQPAFQLEDILDAMDNVPPKSVSGLLSDIVGNQSFRIKMRTKSGIKEGYLVQRNKYFMFQPDYLNDIKIPLALRIAEMPVKRDIYEPAEIKIKAKKPQGQEPVAVAKEEVGAPVAAEAPAAAAAEAEPFMVYWLAIQRWARSMDQGTAPKEDIPAEVYETMRTLYVAEEYERERSRLSMVNWLYENIISNEEFTPENKKSYIHALSQALLEFVWDESISPNQQQRILKEDASELNRGVAREQIVTKGGATAFRYIDTTTGILRYFCGDSPCSEAVVRQFKSNPEDPLHNIQVNVNTTGDIYGFIVPKAKERRLIFKTSIHPPQPGGKPEKAGECTIISTISYHIQMLKDISDLLAKEGYPRFILVEDILDEKGRKKRERELAKAEGRKYVTVQKKENRTFENAARACALKNLILRWMSIMQEKKGGGAKRYMYRPIAALLSGHKGVVPKGA
jgi:hypothetical protein